MKVIDVRQSDSVADTIRFHLNAMVVMLGAGRNEFAQEHLESVHSALEQIPDCKFVPAE
jgi:hypothetical protein